MKRATRVRVAGALVQPATPVPLRFSSQTTPETACERASCSRFDRWRFAAQAFPAFFAIAGLFVFVVDAFAQDTIPSEKPVVAVEAGPTPVTEGAVAQFVVNRSGSTKEELTVSLEVAETGAMISGTAPMSIVLRAGEERKRLTVSTDQDDRNEEDSSITATLTAGQDAAYDVGPQSSATVIVEDDDRASLRLSVQPDSISELGGVSTVTVSLGAVFATDQEIALTFSGSAEMATDYTVGSETLILAAGERSVETVVTAVNDDLAESTEVVVIDAIHGGSGSNRERTILISDDDSARPVVAFVAWPNQIPEGLDAIYNLARTGPTTDALTVSVEISETGSTIDDPVPTSVVFGVGVAQTRMTLRTVDDAVGEPASVITVTLVAGPDAPYALTSNSSVESTIRDHDGLPGTVLPVITVEPESTPVTEGEDALFIVSRAGPAEEGLDVLVEVSTTGSMAFSGRVLTETLMMGPGESFHSFGLVTHDDDRDEPDGTVTLTVTAPEDASYEVGSPSSAIVVVADDDDLAVQVATAVVDANGVAVTEVPEDIGAATIRVTATTNGSVAPTETFIVSVSTQADTAASPDDYVPLSRMVPFPAAEWLFVEADDSYKAVQDTPLEIVDDSLDEPDRESLRLVTEQSPGGPSYVNLPGPISLAIVDDDTLPGQPTGLEAAAAGQTAIDLSWTAPAEAVEPAILGYRIEWSPDGSSDWTELLEDTGSAATTYTDSGLAPGTTRHYRVSAINLVGTGAPSASAAATTGPVPPPITVQEVSIAPGATPVTEGTAATFTLSRTGATAEALTVSVYVTETGSMISGTAPTSVLFGAGDAEATLTVETQADDRDEADSAITATITAGPDAAYDTVTAGAGCRLHGRFGLVGHGGRSGRRRFAGRSQRSDGSQGSGG